jgi:hypothetical protein
MSRIATNTSSGKIPSSSSFRTGTKFASAMAGRLIASFRHSTSSARSPVASRSRSAGGDGITSSLSLPNLTLWLNPRSTSVERASIGRSTGVERASIGRSTEVERLSRRDSADARPALDACSSFSLALTNSDSIRLCLHNPSLTWNSSAIVSAIEHHSSVDSLAILASLTASSGSAFWRIQYVKMSAR